MEPNSSLQLEFVPHGEELLSLKAHLRCLVALWNREVPDAPTHLRVRAGIADSGDR
jgi:hypothetical protein